MFKTHHTKKTKETYFQHMRFAWGTAISMWVSGLFFFIHGIFTSIPVPKSFNLGEMALKLKVKNRIRRIARSIRGAHRTPENFYNTDD